MESFGKCSYCEEEKIIKNLEGLLSVTFFTYSFQSRYIIYNDCLDELKKNKSLTSKDGKCTVVLD